MALGLRVRTQDTLPASLSVAVERAVAPETRRLHDGFLSQSFVRRYTEFESFDAFCRACPCKRDTVGGVQDLPADERDEFVAATTDFETWPEMKRTAAVTDVVTLLAV